MIHRHHRITFKHLIHLLSAKRKWVERKIADSVTVRYTGWVSVFRNSRTIKSQFLSEPEYQPFL